MQTKCISVECSSAGHIAIKDANVNFATKRDEEVNKKTRQNVVLQCCSFYKMSFCKTRQIADANVPSIGEAPGSENADMFQRETAAGLECKDGSLMKNAEHCGLRPPLLGPPLETPKNT